MADDLSGFTPDNGPMYGSFAHVSRLEAERDRLRALVQALEEENAAREEVGSRLFHATLDLVRLGGKSPSSEAAEAEAALDAYDLALNRIESSAALNPPPVPVEGDSGTLSGQSGACECGHPERVHVDWTGLFCDSCTCDQFVARGQR